MSYSTVTKVDLMNQCRDNALAITGLVKRIRYLEYQISNLKHYKTKIKETIWQEPPELK